MYSAYCGNISDFTSFWTSHSQSCLRRKQGQNSACGECARSLEIPNLLGDAPLLFNCRLIHILTYWECTHCRCCSDWFVFTKGECNNQPLLVDVFLQCAHGLLCIHFWDRKKEKISSTEPKHVPQRTVNICNQCKVYKWLPLGFFWFFCPINKNFGGPRHSIQELKSVVYKTVWKRLEGGKETPALF